MSPRIPFIDPSVKPISVSRFSRMNAEAIKRAVGDGALIVNVGETPIAVLVSYDVFMAMQARISGAAA